MDISLSQKVYQRLRVMLVSGEYPPESAISEQQIATLFSCSKTPAREAMAMLCQEGYLLRYPNRGYIVRKIDSDERREMAEFRRLTERNVVALVIERAADRELDELRQACNAVEQNEYYNIYFHSALARLAQNRFIAEAMEKALTSAGQFYSRSGRPITISSPETLELLKESHTHIVEALMARDLNAAYAALDKDLNL